MVATEPIVVEIERDLRDIVNLFLDARSADLARLDIACAAGQMEEVRAIGHKLHGSSGMLGFGGAGIIGADLETAARARDVIAVRRHVAALRDYLGRLSIRYV